MKNLDKLKNLNGEDQPQESNTRKQSAQQGLEDTPKIQNQLMTVYSPLISAKLQRNALKTVVIGVCGGPSSGKIYFAEMLRLYLMRQKIETQVVKQEVYENQQFIELEDRFAWKEMLEILHNHQLSSRYDVIIVEGTLIFAVKELRDELLVKIYLDTDDDVRLSRRIYKDVYHQHKSVQSSVERYLKELKPLYEKYVQPTKRYADIIIPNYGDGYSDCLRIDSPVIERSKAISGFSTVDDPIFDMLTKNVKSIIEEKRAQQVVIPTEFELVQQK